MIQYWMDFGKCEEYRVNWVRETSPDDENSDDIVEIIIEIFSLHDDGSEGNLFSIIYYSHLLFKETTVAYGKPLSFHTSEILLISLKIMTLD
jgi:hypothetical protein